MGFGRFYAAVGALALAGAAFGPVAASASPTYSFQVTTGLSGGTGFSTTSTNPYSGSNTASASFSYTGPLTFDYATAQGGSDLNSAFFGPLASGISGYSGSGTVTSGATSYANFGSLSTFMASSGSAGNYQLGSYYKIDLGVLAKGTLLTITHDDGASVYQNGASVGTTTTGPTTQTTDNVVLSSTADTILYYSRQNGSPSILDVAVPEPVTISIMGAGLLGLCFMRRRASGTPSA